MSDRTSVPHGRKFFLVRGAEVGEIVVTWSERFDVAPVGYVCGRGHGRNVRAGVAHARYLEDVWVLPYTVAREETAVRPSTNANPFRIDNAQTRNGPRCCHEIVHVERSGVSRQTLQARLSESRTSTKVNMQNSVAAVTAEVGVARKEVGGGAGVRPSVGNHDEGHFFFVVPPSRDFRV